MDDQQSLTFIPLGMVKHGDLQFHEFSILTDSCRQQENIPLLPPLDSDENISTTLCLFDPSWIENNRSLVESSARNYAASGERTRFLDEVENLQQRERATKEFLISTLKNNPASANASLQNYSASKNKRKRSTQEIEEGVKQTEVIMARDSSIKRYTQKDEDEEKKLRLSENLVLDQDPFKITKTLTRSDLNDLCRLLIGEKSINNHVFPAWSVEDINKAKSKVGLKVDVWDQNTNSSHTLVLKHWVNWNAYVFINRWRPDFVVRRGLNVGDKIGLYWDQNNKRFTFNVLQRAAAS
ncbi:hypothetical protein ACFE04_014543 [Oxalis oulophora]